MNQAVYYVRRTDDDLMHYGVLGMKWGVRRTPEQLGHRLKKYTSPGIERAKAEGAYIVKSIIARTVPGAGIVFNMMTIGRASIYAKNNFDKTDYTKKEGPSEKLSQLKKKEVQTDINDDLKQVNPRLPGQKGTVNNCMYCTTAMEMRRRGYDVRARRKAHGLVEDAYNDWFEGVKLEYPKIDRLPKESRKSYVNRSYDNLCNEIEKCGNGSRGYVGICYEKMGSGHSMYWEVSNGKVTFYDGQSKTTKNDKLFALADPSMHSYARLDNLKLKEGITDTVISKKGKG